MAITGIDSQTYSRVVYMKRAIEEAGFGIDVENSQFCVAPNTAKYPGYVIARFETLGEANAFVQGFTAHNQIPQKRRGPQEGDN